MNEGQIERLGPVSMDTRTAKYSDVGAALPVIWGPLVDYMYVADEEDFFDGENIVEEGKHGSWIWVILEGVVEIIKKPEFLDGRTSRSFTFYTPSALAI